MAANHSNHHPWHNQQVDGLNGTGSESCLWFIQNIIIGKYYLTAASIVLLLDILLTLDVEVERVWKAKFTRASLLFYINRYLPPLMYSIVLFGLNYAHLSNEFCTDVFQVIPPILIVVSEAVIGALLILRTCALYKETSSQLSRAVLSSLLVVYFVQIGFSVFVAKDLKAIGPIGQSFNQGCILFFTHFDTARLLCLWFTNILFNVIVFMCTFKKTAESHWADQNLGKAYHSMHSLIFLDATFYFLAVMAAKILNLVMLVFYPQWNSVNWAANHVVDVILTSHFFLHLREENDRALKKQFPTSSYESRVPVIVIHFDPRPTGPYDVPFDSVEGQHSICCFSPNTGSRNNGGGSGQTVSASPTRLHLSVQRAIETVLERKGYGAILVCSTEGDPGDASASSRNTSDPMEQIQQKVVCQDRRHSVS